MSGAGFQAAGAIRNLLLVVANHRTSSGASARKSMKKKLAEEDATDPSPGTGPVGLSGAIGAGADDGVAEPAAPSPEPPKGVPPMSESGPEGFEGMVPLACPT